MSNATALETLASLDWNEAPSFTLHEWRACISLARGGRSLQVEYMSLPGCRTMLVSIVDEQGARSDDAVVPLEGMRQLRTLLNATDLSGECGELERTGGAPGQERQKELSHDDEGTDDDDGNAPGS